MMADAPMVTLTVVGREIQVPAGTSIFDKFRNPLDLRHQRP